MSSWTLAHRTQAMDPGIVQAVLKLTEKPEIISLAGGLPAAQTFPTDILAQACQKVLSTQGSNALQYSAGEGYGPLREWVANDLKKQGLQTDAQQIIITTGSQQCLDLISKVLIDPGSRVLVESPTYLGAIQAFASAEPEIIGVQNDENGPLLADLKQKIGSGNKKARFMYMLPNFQNPTGRFMNEAARQAFTQQAQQLGLNFVEDNPYGDLWFEAPPPASLTSRLPEQGIYLGSFSKVLAPGLRLGYMVAPKPLFDKLMYVKMACDLHTPSFTQRITYEVIKDGFLDQHIPTIRALYQEKRDAMLAALQREMAGLDVHWTHPMGGMFLWLDLPEQINTLDMLPKATARHVAYVPGSAFYAGSSPQNQMRLSYVTATVEQINTAIAALAATIKEELQKG